MYIWLWVGYGEVYPCDVSLDIQRKLFYINASLKQVAQGQRSLT